MSLTPVEAADLAAKLAANELVAAEADEKRANADNVRADTEKVRAGAEAQRADVDKVRVDTDKVRAENEENRLLQKNKLDVASADLEAKIITNQKARSDAEDARTTKLTEQLSGAVPDLSSLGKSTVTFGEGRALRQGEAIALALDRVAVKIAEDVRTALPSKGSAPVFVTSETRIVAALASYWQLKDEADLLKAAATKAQEAAVKALTDSAPQGLRGFAGPAQAGLVAAAVAGKAITEVASLFELEVDVTAGATDIPAVAVQAAVIHKLLHPTGEQRITVQHQWARISSGGQSQLRKDLNGLIQQDIATARLDSRLQARIEVLGDPTAELAAVRGASNQAKTEDEQEVARVAVEEAEANLEKLTTLKTAQQVLGAVTTKVKAFADRVSTVSAMGESPLMAAFSIEPLAAEKDAPYVLVLGGATAETFQMLIKRRIFAPRLQVSTTIEVDFFLIDGVNVLASSHSSASVSYHGVITRFGSVWKTVGNLTMPGDSDARVRESRLSLDAIAAPKQLAQENPAALPHGGN